MTDYNLLSKQLTSLLEDQDVWYSNLSQFSALLNDNLDDINWVGFYLVHNENTLKLGPYQGLVACNDIPFGKGVCGTAATTGEIQLVPDVHAFPGHIACDSRSNSEIVIPIFETSNEGKRILGVLDIDSPSLNRFSLQDQEGLDAMVTILVNATNWPKQFA